MTEEVNDKKEQIRQARAARARKSIETIGPGDPTPTDDAGIPIHTLRTEKPKGLLEPGDGVARYPLWTGMLFKNAEGGLQPKIVLVPVAENINGGDGADFYKKRKGWKEVSEIPDKYAEYRTPYEEALAAMRRREAERQKLRKMMAEAGVRVPGYNATTTRSLLGVGGDD